MSLLLSGGNFTTGLMIAGFLVGFWVAIRS